MISSLNVKHRTGGETRAYLEGVVFALDDAITRIETEEGDPLNVARHLRKLLSAAYKAKVLTDVLPRGNDLGIRYKAE